MSVIVSFVHHVIVQTICNNKIWTHNVLLSVVMKPSFKLYMFLVEVCILLHVLKSDINIFIRGKQSAIAIIKYGLPVSHKEAYNENIWVQFAYSFNCFLHIYGHVANSMWHVANSVDLDQPAHPCPLIMIYTVHFLLIKLFLIKKWTV